MHYHLIGCGGIGGWTAQALSRMLTKTDELHLWDGDVLEARNLDRQLFTKMFIGSNKATAVAELLSRGKLDAACVVHPEYFTPAKLEGLAIGILLCAADNTTARSGCLLAVDAGYANMAIIGANEYDTAEAYVYLPQWKDTGNDPRMYYDTEYSRHDEHDPLRPSCTGAVQEAAPQLALANQMAAAYQMWLLHLWSVEAPKRGLDNMTMRPRLLSNTWGAVLTISVQKGNETYGNPTPPKAG